MTEPYSHEVKCSACGAVERTDQGVPDGWFHWAGPREGNWFIEGKGPVPVWNTQGALCGPCGAKLTRPALTVIEGGKPPIQNIPHVHVSPDSEEVLASLMQDYAESRRTRAELLETGGSFTHEEFDTKEEMQTRMKELTDARDSKGVSLYFPSCSRYQPNVRTGKWTIVY